MIELESPESIPAERETEFIAKVVDKYITLRERGLFISSKDWLIISRWLFADYDLDLVLKGLDIAFADVEEDTARTRDLTYVSRTVDRLARERRMMRVGAPSDLFQQMVTEEGKNYLQRAFQRIRESIEKFAENYPAVEAICAKAGDYVNKTERELLAGKIDLEAVISRLARREDRFFADIFELLPDEQREEMLKRADKTIAPHQARMSETARERTRRAILRSFLIRELKVPRLSLF
jgi:hypothetical protein